VSIGEQEHARGENDSSTERQSLPVITPFDPHASSIVTSGSAALARSAARRGGTRAHQHRSHPTL